MAPTHLAATPWCSTNPALYKSNRQVGLSEHAMNEHAMSEHAMLIEQVWAQGCTWGACGVGTELQRVAGSNTDVQNRA